MRSGEQTEIEMAENLTFALGYVPNRLPTERVRVVVRHLSVPDKSENFIRVEQDVLGIVQIVDVGMSGTW